ncbi:hypothetical protein F4776DRAFT_291793 [Hypoxylon sp. NC0597]|nr:hypothetical protein F4776DRAFT_291793 [Hypoxylon sp. NC0597]
MVVVVSQGPLGSAMLLWSLSFRVRVLVTFGFSLITIIALGMDTSAQQVLVFPSREPLLNNASTELGVANMYDSKSLVSESGPAVCSTLIRNLDAGSSLTMYLMYLWSATRPAFKPYFTCPEPAVRCEWGSFTTLGVCSTFANVTDVAAPDCSLTSDTLNCAYSFPAMLDFDSSTTPIMSFKREDLGTTMVFQSKFRSVYDIGLDIDLQRINGQHGRLGSFMAVDASSDGYYSDKPSGDGQDPHAFKSTRAHSLGACRLSTMSAALRVMCTWAR